MRRQQEKPIANNSGFIENHPFLSLIIYFFSFNLVTKVFISIFEPTNCHSYTYGRKRLPATSCDWSSIPIVDLFLDSLFGSGPVMGPFLVIIFFIFPIYIASKALQSLKRKSFSNKEKTATKEQPEAMPIPNKDWNEIETPYGSLSEYVNHLEKMNVSKKEIQREIDKYLAQ